MRIDIVVVAARAKVVLRCPRVPRSGIVEKITQIHRLFGSMSGSSTAGSTAVLPVCRLCLLLF